MTLHALLAWTSRQKHKPRVDLKCTLLVFPLICAALSPAKFSLPAVFQPTILCSTKSVLLCPGFPALPLFHLHCLHTGFASQATPHRFILSFEISPLLGFARLATVPRTLERLMILNLACLKAGSSAFVASNAGRRLGFVQVKPSPSKTTTTTTLTYHHQQLAALKHYFYHNYLYIDSCFSFPFIRFAVVPCSKVCVLVYFFIRGFHDCFQLIL